MRNVKTREGMEFWDKICALKHYGFIHSPDNSRVLKAEGIGNWIDKFEAQGVVDQAQDEINRLRAERNALQQRLTAADELNDTTKAELAWQESDNAELRKRVDVLEGLAVKQAALLDELGIPLDEVDDLFGETLENAKRYEYLRSVMEVENFPAPHPEWSEPSEAESKRIDDLCDAALKPAEGSGDD